eukprot:tig00020960_g16588.t1
MACTCRAASFTYLFVLGIALASAAYEYEGFVHAPTPDSNGVTVSLNRDLVYIGPICAPPSTPFSSPSGAVTTLQATVCKAFWTILWDEPGRSGVQALRLEVYTESAVQRANGTGAVLGVKPGASYEDAWSAAWDANWNSGKGIPADKTYQLLVPKSTLGTIDAPYHLFSKVDSSASSSDAAISVSFWLAYVLRLAGTASKTITSSLTTPSQAFLLRACYGLLAEQDRPEVCNSVRATVELPGANATYTVRALLYGASQMGPYGKPKEGAEASSALAAPAGPGAPASFLFGQGRPGQAGGQAGPVTSLTNLTAPYLVLAVDAPPNTTLAFAAAVSATGSSPASSPFDVACAALARTSDPLRRFTLKGLVDAKAWGMPVWAIVLVVVLLVAVVCVLAAIFVFRLVVRKRQQRMQQSLRSYPGGYSSSYVA